MPRPKKDNHAVSENGNRGVGQDVTASSISSVPSVSSVQALASRYEATIDALRYLFSTDEGWLRIIPQENGDVVYYKWKFSRGRFRGRYVMFRDDVQAPAASLEHLSRKVRQVYLGERRATLDTPYGDDDA